MRNILENEQLKLEVDTFGAELRSVTDKATGREMMWCGDSAYWGRVSPVLFPIVGGVRDKKYRHEGKEYGMSQHGFARDNEFTLISETADSLTYEFTETPETLEKYPFPFRLRIRYVLSENTVSVNWEVTNPSENTMYFSIGAHPAFACGNKENGPVGCTLNFAKKDGSCVTLTYRGLNGSGNALNESVELPNTNGDVAVTDGFFDRSALIFENRQADSVTLTDSDGTKLVTVTTDVPLFAVWSPERKKAPFVCIEPWYGRCDAEDFNGEFKDREYTECLAAGETFNGGYDIRFF